MRKLYAIHSSRGLKVRREQGSRTMVLYEGRKRAERDAQEATLRQKRPHKVMEVIVKPYAAARTK